MVEEHSIVGRSIIERICGRDRRENAGISSESMVRIHAIESLRFPGEGSSAQGKSGPKERPKGVSDGQQVEDSCTTDTFKNAKGRRSGRKARKRKNSYRKI